MKEIWRDIEGYEGYQVSNLGRVKSLKFGKEQILKVKKDRYLRIGLCKDGKQKFYMVHRLVALAFLPNPENLPEINHIDEDKTNNRVENLEWCDRKYNINYGSHNKRKSESQTNYPKFSKKVICVETGVIYQSAMQVKRELGFSNGNISNACNGRCKSAYGFHWRYID